MRIKIKDYGNDVAVPSIMQLKTILEQDYRGRHVAVHLKSRRGGSTTPVFVSVSSAGEVLESYGKQRPVDWDRLIKRFR